MTVTIIGSYSNKDKMLEVKRLFQSFGFDVNCPCEEERNKLPLFVKQVTWIDKIISADLIVAIPKDLDFLTSATDGLDCKLNFGESTSYELAIATHFEKEIVFF